MTTLNVRKNVIAIAVASALGIMAPSAHALVITAATNAIVGTSSDPQSDTASTGSVSSSSGNWPNWATVNGDDSGEFTGSVLAGNWGSTPNNTPLSATAYYSFFDDYTNTSGVTQQYDLSFQVEQGSLYLDFQGQGNNPVSPDNNLISSYSLDIFLNGSSIWGSGASLSAAGFTQTGTSLNGIGGPSFYQWNDFLGDLDLGTFAAGESFTLGYVMNLSVNGSCAADGCEGGARIGDPFNLSGSPTTLSMTPVSTAVPEPGTLMLLGLGLAGVAFAGRRRRT